MCIGLFLSAVTRNSAAAVVGTLMAALLMQLIGILPGLGGAGAVPADDPVSGLAGVLPGADRLAAHRPRPRGCARIYAVPLGVGAYLIFLRRDVAGG